MLHRSYKFTSFILLGLLLLVFGQARAQRLHVRHYDMRDGLAHNRVNTFHQDAKGYLWFGTWEGLSRFDGYRFVNYGTRDGLGHVLINSIAEDRQGRIWVATNGGGVSRLIDDPGEARALSSGEQIKSAKKFASFSIGESVKSNAVNVMIFDSHDNLWCGTDDGIYRSTSLRSSGPEFELVVPYKQTYAALLDRQGRLWFGCDKELIEFIGTALLQDDAQFAALAKQLEADLRSDLATFVINDRATLKSYYQILGDLALHRGDYEVAVGYQVPSRIPGGEVIPLSGTSMSAPQVVNLAAKLLALKPNLTVTELRRTIIEAADEKAIGEGKRIRLLNPKASLERVVR